MENCIPKFWERERESKKAFPTFGNGNGNEKLIPKRWERESEARIPEKGREREFPLTPGQPDRFFTVFLCLPYFLLKRTTINPVKRKFCSSDYLSQSQVKMTIS